MTFERAAVRLDRIGAVVFDTDGVIIDSARVHAAAWKRTFDEFLRRHGRASGAEVRPFDIRTDYLHHLDGRPRQDGVRTFLAARGLVDGQVDTATVDELIQTKTRYFLAEVERYGVPAFPGTVAVVRELRVRAARTAAVSMSRHCARVLAAAHVQAMFDIRVDGVDADDLGLPPKPDPAVYLEAARRLDLPPAAVAVVEDSPLGVEAARRAGFALVVGVDRHGRARELDDSGAHAVVRDLGELVVTRRATATAFRAGAGPPRGGAEWVPANPRRDGRTGE